MASVTRLLEQAADLKRNLPGIHDMRVSVRQVDCSGDQLQWDVCLAGKEKEFYEEDEFTRRITITGHRRSITNINDLPGLVRSRIENALLDMNREALKVRKPRKRIEEALRLLDQGKLMDVRSLLLDTCVEVSARLVDSGDLREDQLSEWEKVPDGRELHDPFSIGARSRLMTSKEPLRAFGSQPRVDALNSSLSHLASMRAFNDTFNVVADPNLKEDEYYLFPAGMVDHMADSYEYMQGARDGKNTDSSGR